MLKRVRLGTSLILICSKSSSIRVIEIDCGRSEVVFSSCVKVSADKMDWLYDQSPQEGKAEGEGYRVKLRHIERLILRGYEERFNGDPRL